MTAHDKTALITGAASRIGASIAKALHKRGCRVFIHYNSSRAAADELMDELNQIRPNSARGFSADLSSLDEVNRLIAEVLEHTDKLDVLINNASRFYPTEVGETLSYQWDDLINSNLRGPYFLSQGLLEPLKSAAGTIINIVDIHANRPMSGHAAYCISKAGLSMMTQSLAKELGPEIRVNGVSPGAILWPESSPSEQAKKTILDRTALQRLGDPSDIASAVVYLAMDAPYVTGEILAVDGGRSLNI